LCFCQQNGYDHDIVATVLTRAPGADLSAVELTHLDRAHIDADLAASQHAAMRDAFAARGHRVLTLPALDGHPDAMFVEDALICLPEVSIVCRPGAASRLAEADAIAASAPANRPVARIAAPATLDGGDVLRIGRTLFTGRSTRTNDAALAQLATIVRPYGYEVIPVDVPGALHLKTAVTAPTPDAVLINPNWVDARVFRRFTQVIVDSDEPFAGNCLPLYDVVFMQAAHPRSAERLRAAGLDVVLIDIGEFAKAEAGLTCLSVVL
jgi:dimethylargininase